MSKRLKGILVKALKEATASVRRYAYNLSKLKCTEESKDLKREREREQEA